MSILFSLASFILLSQDDWKLPTVNSKIQFEFNSNVLDTTKKGLCDAYTSMQVFTEINKMITAEIKKTKFISDTKFTIIVQPYGANMNINSTDKSAMFAKCNLTGNDTLFGSLCINITPAKIIDEGFGQLKCLYRIILKDNTYSIKFRGFELNVPAKKLVNLEEIYSELKPSKSDKEFWTDLKMIISLFNSSLEKTLKDQAADYNFDDK